MRFYKVLNKQVFSQGEYSIVPIRHEDRYDIMKWRNEQIYHLRQNELLTKEQQNIYFNDVVASLFEQEQPQQILFSYLKNDECIGYGGLVHINREDRNAEISFIINTELEKNEFEKHWVIYLGLIEKVAFDELNLHKIYTYAFDLRPHLYKAVEKAGFLKEARLKEHFYFKGEYKDVVIHSKINNKIELRLADNKDVELIFDWANDETTRANSFNNQKISFEEHKKWFENKISNSNSRMYILERNNKPTSFIRFDLDEVINSHIISINIAPEQRGKGLASHFLILALNTLRKESKLDVIAYIKQDNVKSIKSFERAKFVLKGTKIINETPAFKYVYR